MTAAKPTHALIDQHPGRQAFLRDVLEGLSRPRKRIPSKYFYDLEGSRLFDLICELDEYYLTRTELSIMTEHIGAIAAAIGPRCMLIEPGAGSGTKTRLLLAALEAPVGIVPIDISQAHLLDSAAALSGAFAHIEVLPVCADFVDGFELPSPKRAADRRVVYFPGSTIGNLRRRQRVALVRRMAGLVGPGGGIVIGIDLQKDIRVLEAAYNDAEGVTAAFNLNVLARINRELAGDFDVESFRHRAVYNAAAGRIEMHLVSRVDQAARVDGRAFRFPRGGSIRTELSYKFTLDGFARELAEAGLKVRRTWTDGRDWFAVLYITAG